MNDNILKMAYAFLKDDATDSNFKRYYTGLYIKACADKDSSIPMSDEDLFMFYLILTNKLCAYISDTKENML